MTQREIKEKTSSDRLTHINGFLRDFKAEIRLQNPEFHRINSQNCV